MDLVKLAEESLPVVSSTPSYVPVPLGTERKAAAVQLIQDPEATATAVHRAGELILGNMIRNWEPQSIWLGLRDHGIEIPQTNKDKVMAINVLLTYPAFYWEVNAFEDKNPPPRAATDSRRRTASGGSFPLRRCRIPLTLRSGIKGARRIWAPGNGRRLSSRRRAVTPSRR